MNSKDFCESGEELQKISEISEVTEDVTSEKKPIEIQEDRYFIKSPTGNILGGIMEFVGFSMTTFFGIIWIGFCALAVVFEGISFLLIPMTIVVAIIGLFLLMGIKGRMMRNRVKRFKKYKYGLNSREFCDISELAEIVEKTDEFVVKDLKQMIDMKWFLQGHVDDDEKHFILSDMMYEQYSMAMAVLKERQAKANLEKEETKDPECSEESEQAEDINLES